jgi:hypothetical protein
MYGFNPQQDTCILHFLDDMFIKTPVYYTVVTNVNLTAQRQQSAAAFRLPQISAALLVVYGWKQLI